MNFVLTQTNNAVTPRQTFIIGPGDTIDTDIMSDCFSVVILYTAPPAAPGAAFNRAVGQHAGGGPANLNVAALIAAVPAQARPTAMIIVVTGHNDVDEPYDSMNNTAMRAVKAALQGAQLRKIKTAMGWSRGVVSSRGDVAKF